MKTFSILLGLSLVTVLQSFAQVSEQFSDGNFADGPAWHGTTEKFIVNPDLRLQLNASAAGTAWLSTAFSAAGTENLEWEFQIQQAFSPSGANFGRVYLTSDQADLSAPLNGYYLQFGEAGADDAVELFRQSGASRTSVCRASPGMISASFQINVKVTRATDGVWKLFIDYAGDVDYVLEATGIDAESVSSSFFGILCTHTITNATRFYFDNFYIRKSIPPDTIPPRIASLTVTSPKSMDVVFSEAVERNTAEDPLHYFALPASAHPATARLNADLRTVQLEFPDPFRNGYEATLAVKNVEDLMGNPIVVAEERFLVFIPSPVEFHDIIITELFADPSPRVQLPEVEYVEVFNRSENPVQLEGWVFSDGSSRGKLSPHVLLPGEYATLCPATAVSEYSRFGPAAGVLNFPTLNNSGDVLTLSGPDDKNVDSVRYSSAWYRDEDKAAGGWSLERIDTENFCAGEANWIASGDPVGGTPGKQNSVFATLPDNMGPKLLSATAAHSTNLIIGFNETLAAALPSPGSFTIVPSLEVEKVTFVDKSFTSLTLALSDEIQPRQEYTLSVANVYDCPGNEIDPSFTRVSFVLPEKAIAGDIIINEILFNPRTTGVDFLEIYNSSDKHVDLSGWSIRNVKTSGGKNTTLIAGQNLLIGPDEYKVFTEDANVLKGEYVMGKEGSFREMDLPAFNDDAGSAALVDAEGFVIDSMQYTDKMHSPFLKENEGVSLERISFTVTGTESLNWRSASSATGGATPGYVNSNLRIDAPLDDGSVFIEPEIIQRSMSGSDFARIQYRFGHGGLMANVEIIDAEGRHIRQIAENELLGSEGFFRWDADRDNGSPTRIGYYLVWFEIFDAEGFVKTYKKRVVVY